MTRRRPLPVLAAVVTLIASLLSFGLTASAGPGGLPDAIPSAFTPLPTTRIFNGTITPTARVIQIAGLGGVPADATAVVLNAQVVAPTATGYLRVTPAFEDSTTAVQEFVRGQTISNLATVKLNDGQVQALVSAGSARLLFDVSGFYRVGSGSRFTPLATTRVFNGIVATTPLQVAIAGLGGVPAGATAVVMTAEVSAPTAAGYLRVTPAGQDPAVAVQEFGRGVTISNLVIVKLVQGKVQLKVSAGNARVLLDVAGYYSEDPSGALFTPIAATRVYGGAANTVPRRVAMAATVPSVPTSAVAVLFTAEVYAPSSAGYLRVTPFGQNPSVAAQEFARGQTISTHMAVKLNGSAAQVMVSAGTAHVFLDVAGYFTVTTPSSWSTPSSVYELRGGLSSVSCVSSAFCAATDGKTTMQFNGTSWSSPQSLGLAAGAGLSQLSCASASFCVGVGSPGVLASFDGTGWTNSSTSVPDLVDVSCVGGPLCVAIGSDGRYLTNVGSGWSDPAQLSTASNLLTVGCTTTFCLALDASGQAYRFASGVWSGPVLADGNATVVSLSCVGASLCVGVDLNGDGVKYDANATPTWSISAAPIDVDPQSPVPAPADIACASTTFCAVVDANAGITRFDPTTWAAATPDSIPAYLTTASCSSATFCVALSGDGEQVSFNGTTWTAPVVIDPPRGSMMEVSCASSSFCVAADASGDVMSFNGSTWTAPISVDSTDAIVAVSCADGTTFCLAADAGGHYLTTSNGTTWTAPVAFDLSAFIVDVSCPTSTWCMAIDSAGSALTYNSAAPGNHWSAPVSVEPTALLNAVYCLSSTSCVAVGEMGLHSFNGTAWTTAAAIDPGHDLRTVACATSALCYAGDEAGNVVRFAVGGVTGSRTNIAGPTAIARLDCASATSCVAVDAIGHSIDFNGSSWGGLADADPLGLSGTSPGPQGLSCPATNFCVIVDYLGYAITRA